MATPKSISVRIALDGSTDVQKQLEAIGQAGADAFQKLQNAANANGALARIGPALDNIAAKTKALGENAADVSEKFSAFNESLLSAGQRILFFGGAIVGAVAGMGLLVKNAADAADEVQKTADSVGLSTKAFQELSFAAGQSGLSQDQFARGLNKFNEAIDATSKAEFDLANKQAALDRQYIEHRITLKQLTQGQDDLNFAASQGTTVFDRLGVSIARNADGSKNTELTLINFAEALKSLGPSADKAGLVLQAFGARNSRFTTFLSQGAAGIAAMRAEADRIAPPLSKFQLQIGVDLNDAFDRLKKASDNARTSFLLMFAPATQQIVDAFTEAVVANRLALFELGDTILKNVLPYVNDLVAALEGRDGDIQSSFIVKAKAALIALPSEAKKAFEAVRTVVSGVSTVFDVLAAAISGIFGVDLNGRTLLLILTFGKLTGAFTLVARAVGLVTASVRLMYSAIAILPAAIRLVTVAFTASPWGLIITAAVIAIGLLAVALSKVDWAGVAQSASLAWTAIKQFVGDAAQFILDKWNGLLQFFTDLWNGITKLASDAAQGVEDAWNGLVQFFTDMWNGLVKLAADAWQAIKDDASSAVQPIVDDFNAGIEKIKGFLTDLQNWASDKLGAIASFAQGVANLIGGSGVADESQGFAGGGAVRGPGTSRSDSIRAWLSNGEFVINAKAVKKYGTDLFHALNSMRLPSAAGFNLGGLVDGLSNSVASMVPRTHFADGGLALAGANAGGGERPFVLHIGDEVFTGLRAEENTVRSLQKFAVRSQSKSAGRKPSWF